MFRVAVDPGSHVIEGLNTSYWPFLGRLSLVGDQESLPIEREQDNKNK